MAADDPRLPAPVRDVVNVWLRCHDELAPGLIEGLYLVGSVALDDWRPGSDIDIIAFTGGIPSDPDVGVLRDAHGTVVCETGAVDVDGPRLAWSDVADPPAPLRRPWTLHGEFHHDDGCFELNPVMWRTLAQHGVAVRGPEPSELHISADPGALHEFVTANTDTYWRAVAEQVATAACDPARSSFDSEMTTWCVLGVSRMLYTVRTGEIASKTRAGEWTAEQLPEFADLAHHALRTRDDPSTGRDPREVVERTVDFMRTVIGCVIGEPGGPEAADEH